VEGKGRTREEDYLGGRARWKRETARTQKNSRNLRKKHCPPVPTNGRRFYTAENVAYQRKNKKNCRKSVQSQKTAGTKGNERFSGPQMRKTRNGEMGEQKKVGGELTIKGTKKNREGPCGGTSGNADGSSPKQEPMFRARYLRGGASKEKKSLLVPAETKGAMVHQDWRVKLSNRGEPGRKKKTKRVKRFLFLGRDWTALGREGKKQKNLPEWGEKSMSRRKTGQMGDLEP